MLQAAATLSIPVNSPVIIASVQDVSSVAHVSVTALLGFEPVSKAAFSTAHIPS